MRAAAGCPVGTVVLADEQTAGQGRHGHSWHSEAGSGIYCSIVLEPAPAAHAGAGPGHAEAIAGATGVACDLRWPNDVMLGARKVAGILVQLVDGAAIAGIGINVNQPRFRRNWRNWPLRCGCAPAARSVRTDLLIALLPAVDSFAHHRKDDILRLFTHASSYAAGRRVTVDQPDGAIVGHHRRPR